MHVLMPKMQRLDHSWPRQLLWDVSAAINLKDRTSLPLGLLTAHYKSVIPEVQCSSVLRWKPTACTAPMWAFGNSLMVLWGKGNQCKQMGAGAFFLHRE